MNTNSIINNKEKEKLKQSKSKNQLDNIKSIFSLKKIFDKLQKALCLKCINYNKRIQKRLNINLNDYKEYSNIIIEIIPAQNKFCEFINVKKEEESYYDIYFNDSKEKINRFCLKETDKVTKIIIKIKYQDKSL